MPSDTSPRILPFWIFSGSEAPVGCKVEPTVATATFWPTATLGAPHTMARGASDPMETVVNRSRSALGCCTTVSTSPTTTPRSPPGMRSTSSTVSISSPEDVSISATSAGVGKGVRFGSSSFSQAYERVMRQKYETARRVRPRPTVYNAPYRKAAYSQKRKNRDKATIRYIRKGKPTTPATVETGEKGRGVMAAKKINSPPNRLI